MSSCHSIGRVSGACSADKTDCVCSSDTVTPTQERRRRRRNSPKLNKFHATQSNANWEKIRKCWSLAEIVFIPKLKPISFTHVCLSIRVIWFKSTQTNATFCSVWIERMIKLANLSLLPYTVESVRRQRRLQRLLPEQGPRLGRVCWRHKVGLLVHHAEGRQRGWVCYLKGHFACEFSVWVLVAC